MLYNYIKKREERQKIKVFAVKSNFSTKKLQKILVMIHLNVI